MDEPGELPPQRVPPRPLLSPLGPLGPPGSSALEAQLLRLWLGVLGAQGRQDSRERRACVRGSPCPRGAHVRGEPVSGVSPCSMGARVLGKPVSGGAHVCGDPRALVQAPPADPHTLVRAPLQTLGSPSGTRRALSRGRSSRWSKGTRACLLFLSPAGFQHKRGRGFTPSCKICLPKSHCPLVHDLSAGHRVLPTGPCSPEAPAPSLP